MSDLQQSLHLDAESLRPGDPTYMPTTEWRARCSAGVLHDAESEGVICLCGLDEKEWPDRYQASDGTEVRYLPRVEWLASWSARRGDAPVAAEGGPEQVDGLMRDLSAHDPLGVDGLPAVAVTHPVGAPLDPDAAVRVDDPGEVGEDERVHVADSTSGGDVTNPFYSDPWLTVYHGDALTVLKTLPSESVHMVCTSPPFWGLRDYGTATWEGGDPGCDHLGPPKATQAGFNERWSGRAPSGEDKQSELRVPYRDTCGKCGATRIDAQLGLEPTPEEYVANLVAVFREVRRVLRKDGTVWLNLGDSYTSAGGGGEARMEELHGERDTDFRRGTLVEGRSGKRPYSAAGLKPKDLVGIPWRVVFALQADGWYLRSDIIWSKPNPMPESVTDRPTKSHEYLFLLAKSARYYFDADAVRESETEPNPNALTWEERKTLGHGGVTTTDLIQRGVAIPSFVRNPAGRNIRSVWTVATAPYPGAHFATFPPKLIEPCIKAGTSERGVCPECGAPWERVVERTPALAESPAPFSVKIEATQGRSIRRGPGTTMSNSPTQRVSASGETTGWRSSCTHISPLPPRPATILDPFAGSGTTGMVAQSLSRRAVLIDLSLDYLGQLMGRNADIPLGLGA